MQYVVTVVLGSDDRRVLTLDEAQVAGSAADFVFDVLGATEPFSRLIFDRDAQGPFIREGVDILANGAPLDPDARFRGCFTGRDAAGQPSCELLVRMPAAGGAVPAAGAAAQQDGRLREFQTLFVLHRVARGATIDCTRDDPDLEDPIGDLVRQGLLEIDVKRASYRTTEAGLRRHRDLLAEAESLRERFDVFADVEVTDPPRFDTGYGRDLRVAMFERSGIDPFRARFLLGLREGEWDDLPDWPRRLADPHFYDEIFAPVETAPTLEQLGLPRVEAILREAEQIRGN